MGHFLLVVIWNGVSLLPFSRLQAFWGHQFDLSGSCDVIDHVTVWFPISHSYWWSFVTKALSVTVFEIFNGKCDAIVHLNLNDHQTKVIFVPIDFSYTFWLIIRQYLKILYKSNELLRCVGPAASFLLGHLPIHVVDLRRVAVVCRRRSLSPVVIVDKPST